MIDDDVFQRLTLVVKPDKSSEEVLETYEIDVDEIKVGDIKYRYGKKTGLQAEATAMLGTFSLVY